MEGRKVVFTADRLNTFKEDVGIVPPVSEFQSCDSLLTQDSKLLVVCGAANDRRSFSRNKGRP